MPSNKLILIGNSPSSGSTLLADLLDSTPYTITGNELGTFSNKNIFNFSNYKKNHKIDCHLSPYTWSNGTKFNRLSSYGLTRSSFLDMIRSSTTLDEFTDNFINNFKLFRGKPNASYFFEKTPENSNAIGEFLEAFPKSYFIFIVRNPLFVYSSMLRRKIPPYVSLITWLLEASKFIPFASHPRTITVRYEDIVKNPFSTVNNILLKTTRKKFKEEDLKYNYSNNYFRKFKTKKLSSWSARKHGEIIDANNRPIEKNVINAFSKAINIAPTKFWSDKFGLNRIRMKAAIHYFGYSKSLMSNGVDFNSTYSTPISKSISDEIYLLSNFLIALSNGHSSLKDIKKWLNPIA